MKELHFYTVAMNPLSKKYLFLYVGITIFSSNLFSQNYQGISSSQIAYFGNSDLTYILATRTDSVKFVSGDSIFYSYKTLRPNPGSPIPFCSFKLKPNWYGEKVILKSNGEHQFFNQDNDTIHIQSLANLNDTFLVYVYPNLLDTIYGWVSDYDTLPVLGQIDTIKVIELFHSSGQAMQPSKISISKNHGFIKWITPYSFPNAYLGPLDETIPNPFTFELIGTEFPKVGITKPTGAEIYNFDVGNRFIFLHTEEESGSTGFWSAKYTERTILSKTIGTDEVTYLIYDTIFYEEGNYSIGSSTSSYNSSTYSVNYSNLSSQLTPSLPEEFYITSNMKWNTLSMNECNLFTETRVNHLLYNTDTNYPECYSDATLSSLFHLSTDYSVGIGEQNDYGYYNYDGSTLYTNSDVLYVANNNDTCGFNSVLSNEQNEFFRELILYPNPSLTNAVIIKLDANSDNSVQIILQDGSGRIIKTEETNSDDLKEGYKISTEYLMPGLYIITVVINNQIYSIKLIQGNV